MDLHFNHILSLDSLKRYKYNFEFYVKSYKQKKVE